MKKGKTDKRKRSDTPKVVTESASERFAEMEKEKNHYKNLVFQFNQIFNNTIALCMTDKDFNILKVNSAYADMVGKIPEECVGEKCYENRPGKKCHTSECPLQILRENPDSEFRSECYKNPLIKYMITAKPFFGSNGEFAGIVESFQDITELKKIEAELRTKESFLSTVFNTIQDGIMVLDTDFSILQTNQIIEDMYKEEKITGRKCYELYYNRTSPCRHCPVKDALKSRKLEHAELQITSPEKGDAIIELFAAPMMDEDGTVISIVAYGRDITERRRAEECRMNLITELHNALSEIKILKGILPFCSYCKKIRDDNGYWEKVDVYLHEHSNADVSHGICPECMKKYFPEHCDDN